MGQGDGPPAASGTATLHVRVEGQVQGVGYRAFVRAQAQALGLAGWVCNQPDRSVEVAAMGAPDAVAALRRQLETGPPRAVVSAVHDLAPVPLDGSDHFEVIRNTARGAPEAEQKPWWKIW